jgi:hypothetical protein
VLELVVSFHSTGVELLDAGGEGYQLHVIGHLDKTSAEATRATDDDWLKEVIEGAEDFQYDNCRTVGDIVRFKLTLARAVLNRPTDICLNQAAAWNKYNDLAHYIEKTMEDGTDAEAISESESESEDEETVRAAVAAVLEAITKPRARKVQGVMRRANKKSRHSQ